MIANLILSIKTAWPGPIGDILDLFVALCAFFEFSV